MKIDQIQKFDQRQKPAKWAQLFAACLICRAGIDFSGLSALLTKPFTVAVFPVIVFSSFYHLGTSCYSIYGSPKPLL